MYSTFNELLDSWILGFIGLGGMLSSGAYLASNPGHPAVLANFMLFTGICIAWIDHKYNVVTTV